MESDVSSVCFRGDFTIKAVIGLVCKQLLQNMSHIEAI